MMTTMASESDCVTVANVCHNTPTGNNMRILLEMLLVFALLGQCEAWITRSSQSQGLRAMDTMLGIRRGRGSLGKEVVDGEGMGRKGSGGDMGDAVSASPNGVNWIPIQVSAKSLPVDENRVGLIDTNLITIKNAQTNPTGAVSVIRYNGQTYCFAVNCPSCKIPLTKATCLPGTEESSKQPRLVCDFCKATYNVKTGTRLVSAVPNAGFLGGIAKSLFSAKESGPLPVYKLGEKGGKLLIAMNQ
jgi:nitrite reductase/ring-hydroxylating ferredoxin subunit